MARPGRSVMCVVLLALVAGGTACDPGARNEPDATVPLPSCEPDACGAGALCTETRAGIRCDCLPGHAAEGGSCMPDDGRCGDGVVEGRELCDDGNTTPGDGCDERCLTEAVAFADQVVDAPGAVPGADGTTGDPQLAVNGVRGCGAGCGSQDVFSLGLTPDVDNYIVLAWSGRRVGNGPGPDFVVFENAFLSSGGGTFMDLIVVQVSLDATAWVDLPHEYRAPDEHVYSTDPEDWPGFAGRHPVLLHEEDNPVDPFDPRAAGGDAFDLDDLPAGDPTADLIRAEGFRFLRLVSAASLTNPDTGEPYPKEPISNGADVDGVYARWLVPE